MRVSFQMTCLPLILASLFTLFPGQLVQAALREIESQRVESVKIQTSNLSLTIREVAGTQKIKLRTGGSFDSGHSVNLEGNVLVIKGHVEAGNEALDKNTAELDVPAIPVQVDVLAGSIHLMKLSKRTTVRIHKGRVTSKNTAGLLEVFTQQADLNVESHKGSLDINAYGAKLNLKEIDGEGSIECFSGDVTLVKSNGHYKFDLYSGMLKVDEVKGSVNVKSIKSPLQIANLSGRITIDNREGSNNLSPDAETDIQVLSKSGKTVVQLPTSAYLNLQTGEGDLALPAGLKAMRDGSMKVYRGKYRGDDSKIRVTVKSEEGSIQIK